MIYPLVRELAAEGVPVRLTCGVLGFSAQGFYTWRSDLVSRGGWDDAHLVDAIRDVHADDPEFGYRFIADDLERAGHRVAALRQAVAPRRPSGVVVLHSDRGGQGEIMSVATRKGRAQGVTAITRLGR